MARPARAPQPKAGGGTRCAKPHFAAIARYLGLAVTLVLDGTLGTSTNKREKRRPTDMVTIYATAHQTADSIIERLVAGSGVAPAITVITADEAERRLVESLGAFCASPDWLRSEIERAGSGFSTELSKVKKQSRW